MKKSYKSTMCACFTGYIVQAIINNFAPLLFVTFQNIFPNNQLYIFTDIFL